MSFLSSQPSVSAPPPPPPPPAPPTLANASVQSSGAAARAAAAAAGGMDRTIKTSSFGAPKADSAPKALFGSS